MAEIFTEIAAAKVFRSRVFFWSLFVAMLLIDQGVKMWVRGALAAPNASIPIIPKVFEITLTYNTGVAFGMFKGGGVLLTPIAIGIALGAMYYSYRHVKESMWTHAAMALLSSGALGNLFDRLVHKQVTDMFWFRTIDFPVFNVADSCITVAAAILIVKWGREAFRIESTPAPGPLPQEPAAPAPTETLPG